MSHSSIWMLLLSDNKDMATVLLEAGVAEHLEVEESLKNFKSIVGFVELFNYD